ncbi:DNA/RNA polymerase, partial [Ascobolus immersus RN42]
LGYQGGPEEIAPEVRKIKLFENYPVPTTPEELDAFNYLTPYLRRFIPGRAEHTRILKEAIVEEKCLVQDSKGHSKEVTNRIQNGMGAVVFQLPGHPPNTKLSTTNRKDMRVVEYISQRFTPAESRYTNSEREALALVKALKETRVHILGPGSPFPIMVYTDHSALTTLLKADSVKGRIANWQTVVGEHDLRISHIPGKDMQLADGLSRLP